MLIFKGMGPRLVIYYQFNLIYYYSMVMHLSNNAQYGLKSGIGRYLNSRKFKSPIPCANFPIKYLSILVIIMIMHIDQ